MTAITRKKSRQENDFYATPEWATETLLKTCFHSIDFPSEWGRLQSGDEGSQQSWNECNVSIQLISPASGDLTLDIGVAVALSFHSIDFPSEWGHLKWYTKKLITHS